MTQSKSAPSHPLRQVLVKIAEKKEASVLPLAVFDLDSTLFDVGPRLDQILLDFAADSAVQKDFPEQIQKFKDIKVQRKDWGYKEALVRAGLDGHHPELQERLRTFWLSTFFSNEYLQYDQPYDGAVEFVQNLYAQGCEIVYLTGRDQHRMGKGSAEVLKKWNLPLDESYAGSTHPTNQDRRKECKEKTSGKSWASLALKPEQSMDDAEFKRDWFQSLPTNAYDPIYFFENEPVNIHLVRKHLPHVQVIFFDSTHSRKANPPEDVQRIMHFLLEELGEH